MATLDEPGLFYTADVPEKPHPQCLCFITPYLPDEDEFLNKLLNGDYDTAMGYEPPANVSPVGPAGMPDLSYLSSDLDAFTSLYNFSGADGVASALKDSLSQQHAGPYKFGVGKVQVINNKYTDDKMVQIPMNILDAEGTKVGKSSYIFKQQGGSWTAMQELLQVSEGYQDSDAGSMTEAWMDAWMKQSGIKKVTAQTGSGNDAYNKAKAGWGWDADVFNSTGNQPHAIMKALNNAILDAQSDGADAAGFPVLDQMIMYQGMFNVPPGLAGPDPTVNWPTPAEIASLGPVGQQILGNKSYLPFAKVL